MHTRNELSTVTVNNHANYNGRKETITSTGDVDYVKLPLLRFFEEAKKDLGYNVKVRKVRI